MSQKYFVRFRGRVLGPMSTEKMRDLIQRGQVTRMHEISADGIQWQKADEFPGLYPATVKAVAVVQTKADQELRTVAEALDSIPAATKPTQPATEWFANVDGEQAGPVDEAAMKQWANSGRVTSDTLVWKNGMQDWMPAATVRPNWFENSRDSRLRVTPTSGDSEQLLSLVNELRSRQVWVYALAITAIVISALYLIGMVFAVVGQLVAPAQSGGQAIAAILFTALAIGLSVLAFLAFINLLQYANALSVMHFAPTHENVLRSLKKLSTFWLYAGVCVIAALIIFGTAALMVYAAGLRLAYLIGR